MNQYICKFNVIVMRFLLHAFVPYISKEEGCFLCVLVDPGGAVTSESLSVHQNSIFLLIGICMLIGI